MQNNNYSHISQMTDDELRNAYFKMNKKQLVEMLIQNNKVINMLLNNEKKQFFQPLETIPTYKSNIICKSWKDCTNPHYDCVNCPLISTSTSITNGQCPPNQLKCI